MRVFLAGSKELSVQVLDELVAQGHTVVGVLSRDHEEGMQVWLNELGHRSLKARARELNIPVYEKININRLRAMLFDMHLDILFSVFWGEIVKQDILDLPKIGCFNLHGAHLPKNRGSFPMAWAIIKGEPSAGATIHRMDAGVDNGPIVKQILVPISENETGISIYEKVTDAGLLLFKVTLPTFADNSFTLRPQDEDQATYNPRGYPHDGKTPDDFTDEEKRRFKNALHFPPFKGVDSE